MIIENIRKEYNNGFEVDIKVFDLSHQVIGLLGHIGSGKTSILKTISSINNGKVNKFGISVIFKPEVNGLPNIKIEDIIKLYIRYKNGKFNENKVIDILKKFNISIYDNYETFSEGQKELITTALTLSVDTDLVLLDEPFSKIDPINRKILTNILIDEFQTEKKFIISSHEISNIERIVDYVFLIKNGKLLQEDTIANIENNYSDLKEWYRKFYNNN